MISRHLSVRHGQVTIGPFVLTTRKALEESGDRACSIGAEFALRFGLNPVAEAERELSERRRQHLRAV